jgi:hypothetical protein
MRSSWAQFLRFSIFERIDFSITYVFSTNLHIPTPSASTIFRANISPVLDQSKQFRRGFIVREFGFVSLPISVTQFTSQV